MATDLGEPRESRSRFGEGVPRAESWLSQIRTGEPPRKLPRSKEPLEWGLIGLVAGDSQGREWWAVIGESGVERMGQNLLRSARRPSKGCVSLSILSEGKRKGPEGI